jgi:23S rRNA (cytidine1920-2'-O)/16S rRNA (cytidine1409-2'-O)-methyltransferase
MIKEGHVSVDQEKVSKPSFNVQNTHTITLSNHTQYVSRAALKLKPFLEQCNVSLKNAHSLDVGSSTGGFTQILLEKGASTVTAVDVGQNQLHPLLQKDNRVISLEQTDIRSFVSDKYFDLVTCDVSFISLRHIMEALNNLDFAQIIVLFKPQFEVGKEAKRDRHGVVLDQSIIQATKEAFETMLTQEFGWKILDQAPSTIAGKEGNIEHLYRCKKD